MDKKSLWFIAIILCASAIAGYFFVYQPYSEKQLLKQNYVVIKELYETAKSDEPIAGGIKITPNYYPLKDEFDKLSKLKTSLNGLTGKIKNVETRNTLKMMIEMTKDLEEMLNLKGVIYLSSAKNTSLNKFMDNISRKGELERKLSEKTLPIIESYLY